MDRCDTCVTDSSGEAMEGWGYEPPPLVPSPLVAFVQNRHENLGTGTEWPT